MFMAGPVAIEFERDARAGVSGIVGSMHYGVGELEDLCGVTMTTDA